MLDPAGVWFGSSPVAPGPLLGDHGRHSGRQLRQLALAAEANAPARAHQALIAAAQCGDVPAMLRLAKHASDSGQVAIARSWYELAISDNPVATADPSLSDLLQANIPVAPGITVTAAGDALPIAAPADDAA